MTELQKISVGTCEIEILPGSKPYLGKPTSDKDVTTEQLGQISTFRVTSSDELNLIVGLLEWPNASPEVRPVDLINGLQKHDALDGRGSMTLIVTEDGKWLAPLRALKYSQNKKYFTLHGATEEEIDNYLGFSFRASLLEAGAIRFGARGEIDGDKSRTASQLAVLVEPGDIQTLAIAYTATRPLAVINDFGLDL